MIIPVRCVTCGKVLADKYEFYLAEVRRRYLSESGSTDPTNRTIYFSLENPEKTIEGQVLDQLKLKKPCCRRHMLTHVDID
jgi:DNA-directed RNA polymerase I, II, and III subunit RPABC5